MRTITIGDCYGDKVLVNTCGGGKVITSVMARNGLVVSMTYTPEQSRLLRKALRRAERKGREEYRKKSPGA